MEERTFIVTEYGARIAIDQIAAYCYDNKKKRTEIYTIGCDECWFIPGDVVKNLDLLLFDAADCEFVSIEKGGLKDV